MVDAKNLLKRLAMDVEDGKVNEAEKQIAFADKILLNKVDLVSYATTVVETVQKFNRSRDAVGLLGSPWVVHEISSQNHEF